MAIDKFEYWKNISIEDLDVAEDLFKAKRWLYVAFMCHQAIEKILKAYWNATREDEPPYVHNHRRLAEGAGLYSQMSDEQHRFLGEISNGYYRSAHPRASPPVRPRLQASNQCPLPHSAESVYVRLLL